MLKSMILLSITCLLLAGCSTYGYKTRIGANTYAPVDYHKVKLLFGAPPQPYDVIGVVSVDGGTWASAGDMYQKLIKSAAVLGADAVIVTGEGSSGAVYIPGTSFSSVNAYSSGNNATATGITTHSPGMVGELPTNKGLAIKFTGQAQ